MTGTGRLRQQYPKRRVGYDWPLWLAPRRELRPLAQRAQFRVGDGDRDLAVAGGRLEAAIVAEEHVLAAGDLRPALHAVGDELGMLDHHVGMRDRAGDEDLAGRQLDTLEQMEFVLVARIGRLEGIGAGLDREV